MSMYHEGAQLDKQKSAGHHRSNDTFSTAVTYSYYREPVEMESYRKVRPNTSGRRKHTSGEDTDSQWPAMDEVDAIRSAQPRRREGQARPKSRLGRQRPKNKQSLDNDHDHVSQDVSQSIERRPSQEIKSVCRSSFNEPSDDPREGILRPRTSRGVRSDLMSPEVMTSVTLHSEHRRPETGYRRDYASNLVCGRTPSSMSSSSLTPSPPPPSSQYVRPKSSMGSQRHRTSSRTSSRDAVSIARCASVLGEFTPPPRPMSRYAVLPSIGTKVDLEMTENSSTPRPVTHSPDVTPPRAGSVLQRVDSLKLMREYSSSETETEEEIALDLKFKQLTRPVNMPPEPSAADSDSIVLAVKLPHNGKRVKRRFWRSDALAILLRFAESIANLDFDGFQLVCDVEKKTFTDLDETIAMAGLPDRTLLHIQLPEMF